MLLASLRAELAETLRRAQRGGLVLGAAGNASARAESELIVISPTSVPYEDLTPELVSVVRLDGRLCEGAAPSIELPLHLAVLAARPDAGAVLHTHSPYATALASVLDELPVVAPEQAAAVGGPTPVVPYAPTGTAAHAEAAVGALVNRWAAVVRNHGPVCLGRDLADALACAFAVEEAARVLALARVHGEPPPLPAEEVARVARLAGRAR